MNIYVAMSGGIDSSFVAYLLKNNLKNNCFSGYNNIEKIIGITMFLGDSCNSVDKVRKICDFLQIDFEVIDLQKEFEKEVIKNFNKEIEKNTTPIPCVECNKKIKLGKLLDYCKSKNSLLATGHYANIIQNSKTDEYEIHKAKDVLKDQTHFLNQINKNNLPYILFPLGKILKSDVYRLSKENGLIDVIEELQQKKYSESQDVCFFQNKTYGEYIKSLNIKQLAGEIRHIATNQILGQHNGLIQYTIGQRQGLGIAWKEPLYVVKKDINNNILYVGKENCLYSNKLSIKNVNLLFNNYNNIVNNNILNCQVCLRDKTPLIEAEIELINNKNNKIDGIVKLKQKARAITSGQNCVFYKGTRLLGGGEIK